MQERVKNKGKDPYLLEKEYEQMQEQGEFRQITVEFCLYFFGHSCQIY